MKRWITILCSLLLWLNIQGQNTQTKPLGINLGGISSWSQGYAFVDIMKCSRPWISMCSGCAWGAGSTLPTDDLGWVTSLPANHWATTVMLDGNEAKPAGIYNLYYEGEGNFNFLSSDLIDTTYITDGHIQLEIADGTSGIWLEILETDPNSTGNYLKNIRLVMPGFENVYQTEPFHPNLIAAWDDFSLIRFMDWGVTNNNPVTTWGDRTRINSQTQAMPSGVAPEYIIALANQMQKDAWICIPHQADDTYVTELATLLRDNLNANLKIYIEYSNEVWNGIFSQAGYASAQGLALGLSANGYEAQAYYYAQRSVEIFNIFETVFGNLSRLERVIAWQNFNTTWSQQILDYNNTYQSTDAFAIAPYFGGGLGDPATADSIAAMSIDSILYWCEDELSYTMQGCRQQAEIAKARGVSLIAYEGGQHLVGHSGAENNTALEAKLIAVNRDSRMQAIYAEYYERWKIAGGELFATFSSMGSPSKWGSWGLLEHYEQDYWTTPKFAASEQFNDANSPPWWQSPNPVVLEEGTQLINFDGTTLPALTITQNRNYTVNSNDLIIPFDMTTGNTLFTTGDNQSEFYGGVKLDWLDNAANTYIYNLGNYGTGEAFITDMHSTGTDPVQLDLIFLWKKDQFLNGFDAVNDVSIGKLKINITVQKNNTSDSDCRFVVLQDGQYYISDFMTYANGSYELDLFNNSETPEKRWYHFNPTANAFGVPAPLAQPFAMNFTDVDAVGFVVSNYRFGYGATFAFDQFQVYTKSAKDFTVRVNQKSTQADPTTHPTILYEAVFSEATNDFDATDVTVYGSATDNGTTPTVTEIAPFDGTTYQIEVTNLADNGFVVVRIDSLKATNASGATNFLSTTKDNIVAFNGANNPTVTINQASTQADPTLNTPILFDIVFSEAITNFDVSDITLSGSANPTTAVLTEVAPFDNTTYQVAVSGMSADGYVIVNIAADRVETPLFAKGNLASTSTDNQVEFVHDTPTAATLIQFQGTGIPSSFTYNRSLQLAGNSLSQYIPFGVADGDNLFAASSYNQMEIYGGVKYTFSTVGTNINHEMRNNDTGFSPNTFWCQVAGGDGHYTSIDMLYLWRKDQFLNNMPLFQVGFDNDANNSSLSINVTGKRENLDMRFVIKQGGVYYMSEFSANLVGLIELTEFNNSNTVGKRWGIITPTALDFSIPTTLPTFQAVDFNNIEAVGFICHSPRSTYSNFLTFDAFSANGITINNPLPVELLDFQGSEQDGIVHLTWSTVNEINNSHFEVEWSREGIDFPSNESSNSWKKIGEVQGARTTTDVQRYEFLHANPRRDVALQRLYYRLKQVDIDGTFDYSNIINITIKPYNNTTIKISPNPVQDYLTINAHNKVGKMIQIINLKGQIVKELWMDANAKIDVSRLSAGTYWIRLNKESKTQIFIKQ